MDLEVLVSTMNEIDNEKLINRMNIETKSITVNQVTKSDISLKSIKESKNRLYSYNEKGLSKSRNKAISLSNADICVIADNDVRYVKDYEKIILNSYKENPEYDIIIFNLNSNTKRKSGKLKDNCNINVLNAMRIVSSQITFRRESALDIPFDENFGAGTYFDRGEETIWLVDCIKSGKKIKYIDNVIANVDEQESTWFKGFDEEFLKKQGAVFYRLMSKYYMILIIQYAIRKYKLYKKNTNIYQAIKLMNQGKKEYENKLKEENI